MNTPVFRRRAERFAQLLDEATGGRRHRVQSPDDDDLARLVALGQRMSAMRPPVEADPEFRTGLRALLLATAEREGIGATAKPPSGKRVPRQRTSRLFGTRLPGRRGRVRTLVILGVAAGAITVSGMSAASEHALPGDALYSVKRSTERAHLALATSDVQKARVYLDIARIRLAEARALRDNGDSFTAVLDDMDAATRRAARLLAGAAARSGIGSDLDALTGFVDEQRHALAALRRETTGAERSRLRTSLALLDSIDHRADAVREALACEAGFSGSDALGPRPHSCGR